MHETLPTETGNSFWVAWPPAMGLSPVAHPHRRGNSEEAPTSPTGKGWKVNA
jgi:hypothetical protein